MTTRRNALSALARRTPEPPISWLMKMTLDHPGLVSLAAGFTDNRSLPLSEARELLRELLGSTSTGLPALQYGTTQGDPLLRRLSAGRLHQADRSGPVARYSPDRLIVTHGSQQLLYLVTECLCDPGDVVLVEDPTYFVYLGIGASRGLSCRGVRMGHDGVDLGHLEKILAGLKRSGSLSRVKLLYLVSYFQNPSGVTTSFEKKRAALDLLRHYERAAGHPIYLLEDAAYRELPFDGVADVPSALAAGGSLDRVIYAGTYSKPFATGVRIGFGLLPEPLLTAVARVKGNHDFGTSNLLQQLLARALDSGAYERHLPVLRARYARKARVMTTALRAHFPKAVRWEEPRGGLYVWAQLPRQVSCGVKSAVFRRALKQEVLYVPGELCYADDPARRKPGHEMRLSFGGATESDIRAGVQRLGKVLSVLLPDSDPPARSQHS